MNSVLQPVLLGGTNPRLPTMGKIRAGVKVLTRKASEHPQAVALYEQGLAAGDSFDLIEKKITQAIPSLKSPLVPKNVPWFTVRLQDFAHPELARIILDKYGEVREDGVKRLYCFPAVFPADEWAKVMPHELAAWGTHDKRFWSEYSDDGHSRVCMMRAPVPMDVSSKRAVRLFGGRKPVPRPDNQGRCEPEQCPEYQKRQCNLSGRFVFFIPGIPSLSAFELHTHSFYAMSAAIQTFQMVSFLRGGKLSGFLDRKRTSFYFTKTLKDVAHINEEGKSVRVSQWVIDLQAPIDVTALLNVEESDELVLAQAHTATQLLQGTLAGESTVEEEAEEVSTIPISTEAGVPGFPEEGAEDDEEESIPKIDPPSVTAEREPSLNRVLNLAESFGLTQERFLAYAQKKWGSGWKLNALGRQRAYEELERYRNDPDGYFDKIDTELSRAA